MIKRHARIGHFDDEGFCRCGQECCVHQFTGECLCRRCTCQSNEKADITPANSYHYDGAYKGSYSVGVDLLRMQPVLDEDGNLAAVSVPAEGMPPRGEFVD